MDAVTEVSTGTLIAPFAFLGDERMDAEPGGWTSEPP